MTHADADYIVIGSGAGGGPLAANLARAGRSVILLEAGGDPCADSELGRWMYEVPIFHGFATEYPECQWDYFVRHYTSDTLQRQDSKYVAAEKDTNYRVDGVWYPRAGTLGGCTAHNAMITITPQDRDWDAIAAFTKDDSWRADNMHQYYERLENCTYRPRPGSVRYMLDALKWRLIALLKGRKDGADTTHGHGFDGWLTTSAADPRVILTDKALTLLLLNSVKESLGAGLGDPALTFLTQLDPNDLRNAIDSKEGLAVTPLAVANGKRNGPREFLLKTRKDYPSNLTIRMHALATRILFDGKQAIGVEYYDGPHQYEADPAVRKQGGPADNGSAPLRQLFAAREVILCGGAFNSPQLLKLSGIGPRDELARFGIPLVQELPGVGENLQDRYEVGVISEFDKPFVLLERGTFAPPKSGVPDPFWDMWQQGKGVYASNGALIGILKRSRPNLPEPDLFIFGLPGFFRGYEPGYSAKFERQRNRFTWAILKAYTENTAGRVTLRSKNPRAWPSIEFRYFAEGNDKKQADLDAVVDGVRFARTMNDKLSGGRGHSELCPGPGFESDGKLKEFIANEAWGHHASCTNRMGPDGDPMAVLDSRFQVRGVKGLRVVDASVFPRIPGYFIVTPVYMISEKAFDVIAAS
jgi:choline dehydrogenase